MAGVSFQSHSSLEITEKNRPFVRLNMADDRDAHAIGNSNSDLIKWDTYNVANRRPLTPYKPKFYRQLFSHETNATSSSHIKVFLSSSITASRRVLLIFGVLGLFWVPAILQFTLFKNGQIWGVSLLHWSIWLTVFWGTWWAATVVALILPFFFNNTVGKIMSIGGWTYLQLVPMLTRYITFFLWSLSSWISFQPLVVSNVDSQASSRSVGAIALITRLLFGIFICAVVLLGEKIVIQIIAQRFHEESYADRIEEQRAAMHILISLYTHTPDTLPPDVSSVPAANPDVPGSTYPTIKPTASVLRQVAENLLGFSFILPESAEAQVLTALCSANETRLLARRIYYSFARPGASALVPADIASCFGTEEQTMNAFHFFDKDGNGNVTREEIEAACMECHNEQLSLANSLRDLDSAVGRLDNIFMTLYTFIAILIIAVVLDSQLSTLLLGTGTFILGLSWLIGGSLTEVLTSIIFLFLKHPYDVGDRIIINSVPYTVREIFLLSTILLDSNNTSIQAPHVTLATQSISNIRRSPLMSETFIFDVGYSTKLESLELFRDKMLQFVKSHSRDYIPSFDVVVVDIPGQSKMTLSADIKYKSNWQQGTLRTQRRNRWLCALKECLAEIKIYGPAEAGAPPQPSKVVMYTEVPWAEAQVINKDLEFPHVKTIVPTSPSRMAVNAPTGSSVGQNNLFDKNAAIFDSSQNVFNETEDLTMSNPVLRTSPKAPARLDGV